MLVGIDVGTRSCKAVVFSSEGAEIACETESYGVERPEEGYAEHSAEKLVEAVREALSRLAKEVDFSEVDAVGVTGFGRGVLPLDSENKPLAPAILTYMDSRSEEVEEEFPELNWGKTMIFKNTEWIEEQRPGIAEELDKVVDFRDYLAYRMTGNLRRNNYGFPQQELEERCRQHGMDTELFPEPASFREKTGKLSESFIDSVDSEVPVVVGPWDAICSAVGSGLYREGEAMAIAGTTTVVAQIASEGNKPYFRDGKELCLGGEAAASAEEWMKDLFDIDYTEVNRMIKEAEPEETPITAPFLDGERKHPERKGAITGLGLSQGKEELARSFVEAEAYYIRQQLERFGNDLKFLVISGGRSRNGLRNRIKADVLGETVRKLEVDETSALGAAILAATSNGVFDSLEEAENRMVKTAKEYEPGENQELYDEKFEEYMKTYRTRQED
ncbi:MAG: FGGY-family carbohydrate kinase [Candidatus Nanohalobium sp.]